MSSQFARNILSNTQKKINSKHNHDIDTRIQFKEEKEHQAQYIERVSRRQN